MASLPMLPHRRNKTIHGRPKPNANHGDNRHNTDGPSFYHINQSTLANLDSLDKESRNQAVDDEVKPWCQSNSSLASHQSLSSTF